MISSSIDTMLRRVDLPQGVEAHNLGLRPRAGRKRPYEFVYVIGLIHTQSTLFALVEVEPLTSRDRIKNQHKFRMEMDKIEDAAVDLASEAERRQNR